MKFQLAINLERLDDSLAMDDVARHTLEMVKWLRPEGLPLHGPLNTTHLR